MACKGVALRMVVKEDSFLVILTTLALPVYFEDWTAVAEEGKCTSCGMFPNKTARYGNAVCWTCRLRLHSAAISIAIYYV